MMRSTHDPATGSDVDSGSAIVGAVMLGLVLAVLAGTVVARISGATAAAAASVDRVEARTEAEYVLAEALLVVDRSFLTDDGLSGPVGARRAAEAALERLLADLDHPPGRDVSASVGEGSAGSLVVRVDATVGRASSSASATVRAPVSSDYLWLSEHRAIDPSLLQLPRVTCALPSGHPERDATCIDARVGPVILDGPVHTNETLPFVDGTVVGPLVSTSTPGPPSPDAADPGRTVPRRRSEIMLPRDARAVAAASDVTCRFRGPTLIRLDGDAVRVRSPRSVPRAGDPHPEDDAIGCAGIDRSALDGFVSVVLPDLAVIEVVRDAVVDCVDHPLGLSQGEDSERDWWCSGGDAFVWGQYRGSRTVIAEDNVQIVWDVEPSAGVGAVLGSGAADTLGLVAGDSIVLRRPVGRPIRRIAPYGRNLPSAGPGIPPFGDHPLDAPTSVPSVWESPRIGAALVALRGSVTVQNPFRGQRHLGPLSIRGSVAGRFSGVFGWEHRNSSGTLLGATGYEVEMAYDPRLVASPPRGMPVLMGDTLRIIELDVG